MTLFETEPARATDSPEACVGVDLETIGADELRFSVDIIVLKGPPDLPPGNGVGVGYAPVEGIAKRRGKSWELRQLFKPK